MNAVNGQPAEGKGSHYDEHHLGNATPRLVGADRGEAEGSGLNAGPQVLDHQEVTHADSQQRAHVEEEEQRQGVQLERARNILP